MNGFCKTYRRSTRKALLHLERKDAIGAAGLLIVVDGSALYEGYSRLQQREGDNHRIAGVEMRGA